MVDSQSSSCSITTHRDVLVKLLKTDHSLFDPKPSQTNVSGFGPS